MQTKTSRLIFPYDKTGEGIFLCLNIYSSVISACSGVRFFQNDRVSLWEGHTLLRCLSQAVQTSMHMHAYFRLRLPGSGVGVITQKKCYALLATFFFKVMK